jgi:hypothetical protein
MKKEKYGPNKGDKPFFSLPYFFFLEIFLLFASKRDNFGFFFF